MQKPISKLLFCLFSFLLFNTSCNDEPEAYSHISNLMSIQKIDIEALPIPDLGDYDYYENIKDCSVEDLINNKIWKYNLLLPPSYKFNQNKNYPVLFLLHGLDSGFNSWLNVLKIKEIIDYYHAHHSLREMIVVMPEAENTYYVNNNQENVRYEDFFFDIFLPHLQNCYRIKGNEGMYMISGFSMGGYGAAYYALKYYDLFGFCYSMTAPLDGKGLSATMPSLFSYFKDMTINKMPKFIFDVGYDDYFIKSNIQADILLEYLKLPHEFIYREGSHDSNFWTESLYLMFDRINQYLSSE